MIGYLFLAIAVFSGAVKGYCGKKTGGYVDGYKDAMLANLIRMVLCVIIGVGVIFFGGDIKFLMPDIKILAITAMSGITTSVFVICWLISVRKGAYMMLDVFLMMGVLVTILLGRAVFGENIALNQWIGMAILLVAVFIMCSYNNSIKEKMNITSVILLILCGLSNGLTDFSQKLFTKQAEGVPISIFNFYTYIFSAVTLIIFYILSREKSERKDSGSVKKIFGYILIMAICLFANSYFKTVAALHLESAALYPLSQGSSLILSSLMAAVLFKEKLTLKAVTGLILAFLGLLIINLISI